MKLIWLLTISSATFVVAKPLDRDTVALTTLITRGINNATSNPSVAIPLTSRSAAATPATRPQIDQPESKSENLQNEDERAGDRDEKRKPNVDKLKKLLEKLLKRVKQDMNETKHASGASTAAAFASTATPTVAADHEPTSNNNNTIDERRVISAESSTRSRASRMGATTTSTLTAITQKSEKEEEDKKPNDDSDDSLRQFLLCAIEGSDCYPTSSRPKFTSIPTTSLTTRSSSSFSSSSSSSSYGCSSGKWIKCSFKATWGNFFRNISDRYEKCMNKCREEEDKVYNETVRREDEEEDDTLSCKTAM